MCGLIEQKKPRLFYYEETCEGFVPIIENEIPGIIDIDRFDNDGEVIELQLKRIDMTDKEFENIPNI